MYLDTELIETGPWTIAGIDLVPWIQAPVEPGFHSVISLVDFVETLPIKLSLGSSMTSELRYLSIFPGENNLSCPYLSDVSVT